MNARRLLLILSGLALFALVLAACSPAPTSVPIQTGAPQPTTAPFPTQAPAATLPPEVTATQPSAPTPIPTQAAPTATAVLESRVVELEWPPQMRLGDSDVVRLALLPSLDGYTVTT